MIRLEKELRFEELLELTGGIVFRDGHGHQKVTDLAHHRGISDGDDRGGQETNVKQPPKCT